MTKNIVYLIAVLLITAAASTGIVMAKQYQASQLTAAPETGPPISCPCQKAGSDCHCTDNGQPCGCGQNGQQCGCSSGCHQTTGQSQTTE